MAEFSIIDRQALRFIVEAQVVILNAMLTDGRLTFYTEEKVRNVLEVERLLRLRKELTETITR
jgi:hypothetical protein